MTVDVAREEEPYDSRFLVSDARRSRFAKEIAKLHRHVPIQWHVCWCQAHRPFVLPRHKGRDRHKKIQAMQVQILGASFSSTGLAESHPARKGHGYLPKE